MTWEIALVPNWNKTCGSGSASEVITGFTLAIDAARATMEKSKEGKTWVWARTGEIPRKKDAIIKVKDE